MVDTETSKSAVEKHYDCSYQSWQLHMNQFGAKAKMGYFAPYAKPHFKCAEFGSSSGNIISAMPCKEKIGIELNTCGRNWGKKHLNLTSVDRSTKLVSNSLDMVITTSVSD